MIHRATAARARRYRCTVVLHSADACRVLLDGKPLRTPAGVELVAAEPVAAAIAAEWEAQEGRIRAASMPIVRLVCTAIDRIGPAPETVVDAIAAFATTDLVCYRAVRPEALVARQQALWQPLVDWATLRYDAPLLVTSGVMPRPQPPAALAALRRAVAGLDPLRLAALHSLTEACGSLAIGLAVLDGRLDAAGAWQASQLDESFQIEQWGEDSDAGARRAALRREIEDSCRFLALLDR